MIYHLQSDHTMRKGKGKGKGKESRIYDLCKGIQKHLQKLQPIRSSQDSSHKRMHLITV
mgnify:CR=1 FL=1